MDFLNDKDLDIAATNESHKNIEKEELEKTINRLDVKKACREDNITDQIIKPTYNGIKSFLLKELGNYNRKLLLCPPQK